MWPKLIIQHEKHKGKINLALKRVQNSLVKIIDQDKHNFSKDACFRYSGFIYVTQYRKPSLS